MQKPFQKAREFGSFFAAPMYPIHRFGNPTFTNGLLRFLRSFVVGSLKTPVNPIRIGGF